MSDRNAYIEMMKTKLDEWNAEIDKLEEQAKAAEADAKADYEKHLAEMRRQRDEAQAKLKEAQDANDAAWDDMRKGMESAWETISNSFKSAMNRFR
jgi:chromosome segregation ATPase